MTKENSYSGLFSTKKSRNALTPASVAPTLNQKMSKHFNLKRYSELEKLYMNFRSNSSSTNHTCSNVITHNLAIKSYLVQGDIQKAHAIFKEVESYASSLTLSLGIQINAHLNKHSKIVELYNKLSSRKDFIPDMHILATVMHAHNEVGSPRDAIALSDRRPEFRGLFIDTVKMESYFACNELDSVLETYNNLKNVDNRTNAIMMKACLKLEKLKPAFANTYLQTALKVYEVNSISSEEPDIHYLGMRIVSALGGAEAALDIYHSLENKISFNPEAHALAIDLHAQLDEPSEAMEVYYHNSSNPGDLAIHHAAMNSLLKERTTSTVSEATEIYEGIDRPCGSPTSALAMKAYMLLQHFSSAINVYETSSNRSLATTALVMEAYFKEGKYQKALHAYSVIPEKAILTPEVCALAMRANIKLQQYQEVEKIYHNMRTNSPTDASICNAVMHASLELNKYSKATAIYDNFINTQDCNPNIYTHCMGIEASLKSNNQQKGMDILSKHILGDSKVREQRNARLVLKQACKNKDFRNLLNLYYNSNVSRVNLDLDATIEAVFSHNIMKSHNAATNYDTNRMPQYTASTSLESERNTNLPNISSTHKKEPIVKSAPLLTRRARQSSASLAIPVINRNTNVSKIKVSPINNSRCPALSSAHVSYISGNNKHHSSRIKPVRKIITPSILCQSPSKSSLGTPRSKKNVKFSI